MATTHTTPGNSWLDVQEAGEFKRKPTAFHDRVTADGSSGYKAEPNRYHLYVSLACPWAHRTLIFRKLKGLEDVIGVSQVHYLLTGKGWDFHEGEGVVPDPVMNAKFLSELYFKADDSYSGRITVPVLFDKQTGRIVNNESSEIIRMFNTEFNAFAKNPSLDLYPESHRSAIDEVNGWVYDGINNGVYKSGFATTQSAYEKNVTALFESLDRVEAILSKQRYLAGDVLTEADIRLFTTLLRFDPVYHGHFKCNLRRIADYPNMLGFLREIYQLSGVSETVDISNIKKHYYMSHLNLNPTQVVPLSNGPDLSVAHGRDRKY